MIGVSIVVAWMQTVFYGCVRAIFICLIEVLHYLFAFGDIQY